MDKLKVFKTAMRIIIEDESCDIIENASLLMARIKEDYLISLAAIKAASPSNKLKLISTKQAVNKLTDNSVLVSRRQLSSANAKKTSPITLDDREQSPGGATKLPSSMIGDDKSYMNPLSISLKINQTPADAVRAICDEVIKDSIGSCLEADYKMELTKLLSAEAKIELYIEQGKLSDAQRLAFTMNRPDYVSNIIVEAGKLNQDHIKTVCQLWLAKHETRNPLR